jgi:sulfate adenylyltransferase subunit 2
MISEHLPLDTQQVWTTRTMAQQLFKSDQPAEIKKTERWITDQGFDFNLLDENSLVDEHQRKAKQKVTAQVIEAARKKRKSVLFAGIHTSKTGQSVLFANDGRNGRRWVFIPNEITKTNELFSALTLLATTEAKDTLVIPTGMIVKTCRALTREWQSNALELDNGHTLRLALEVFSHGLGDIAAYIDEKKVIISNEQMTHLDRLEAESIHIIREVFAQADNPVMLYSVGKDSSVMLHLARKAFYPSPPPFPLMHIDTRWKFQAMYDFRDKMAQESGMDLLVHINPDGIEKDINPFDHGSARHTDIMKTQGLKQALDYYKFDVAFGGARRDEEKSRAKERVFSFRTSSHRWDPKNQRPELWHQYNARKNLGESIRAFPISNWTELDIWQYIYREQIPLVPLYFAAERPVVERGGMLMMVDDDRLKLFPDEKIHIKKIRFRTLGCYPLTGAIESDADDLASIVLELLSSRTSERQGRAIDNDSAASMEKKKQEGYF